MSTTETERDLRRPTFETVEELGRLRWRDGRDIVVAVRRSPEGRPAIDVREYVTRDAYSDSDFKVIGGPTRKPKRKDREPYVGPTRTGWWITEPSTAEGLADMLARATASLESQLLMEG